MSVNVTALYPMTGEGTYSSAYVVKQPIEQNAADIDVERVLRHPEGLEADVKDVLYDQ